MKYEVKWVYKALRTIIVEADDEDDAIDKAKEREPYIKPTEVRKLSDED